MLTNSTGAVEATFTYDPYGNLTASTGNATTAFLFAGQYRDAESAFYYLRARYYDPATAQFLSIDPGVAKTLSPYGYVAGDPLNLSDPSGRTPADPNGPGLSVQQILSDPCGYSLVAPNCTTGDGALGFIFQITIGFNPWPSPCIDNPASLWGLSPEQLDELIPADWARTPSSLSEGGQGFRWFKPGTNGSSGYRWMPGNPGDPNPLKQGPYIRGFGEYESGPIPAAGNPTLPDFDDPFEEGGLDG
jgi:RHS repeat-associated protein